MITLDFETYWTSDYTLKKLTTEQYIRNPLFTTLGVGIKVDNAPCVWHCGSTQALRGALGGYDWNQPILVHNGFFDLAILNWVYDIRPKLLLDTMLMAKPKHAHDIGVGLDALASYYDLGNKTSLDFRDWHPNTLTVPQATALGEYCSNDVELTYKLFQILRAGFPLVELAVINKVLRMYSEPSLILNTAYLQQFADDKIREKDELLAKVGDMLGIPDLTERHLSSAAQFTLLLTELDQVIPLKQSPTNPNKLIPALAKTDAGFKALLNSDNPAIKILAEARQGVRSVLDRTRALALLGVAERGALPIMLNYYGAHTGRFSGGEKLNLQNLPRNGKLRKALLAPPGYVVIACDSGQIEARMTAWLANQLDLLQQFRDYDSDPKNSPSPYELMASTIYGKIITRQDTLERFVGKTCILGLGYGMGAAKLRVTLKIGQGGISVDYPEAECDNIVNIYRAKNGRIKNLWREGERVLHTIHTGGEYRLGNKLAVSKEGIRLPNGMHLRYISLEPNSKLGGWGYCNTSKSLPRIILAKLRSESYDNLLTRIYGPKVIENVVQALARIAITEQMIIIGRRYHVALQVHDENVMVVKQEEAEEATRFIREVMTTPPSWAPDLPVNCEIGVGKSYGDC